MGNKITAYVAGKKWHWYIPVLALCVYIFIASIGFNPNTNTSPVLQALYTIQFGVHEISHLATAFLPSVITAASGSLSELVLTGTFVGVALYSRAYFAAVFSGVWFMLACQSAGMYMADARAQQLQLVSFGEKAIHDWHYVFGQLGLLRADTTIGTTVKVTGMVVGVIAIAFGTYLIIRMMAYRKPVEPPDALARRLADDPIDAISKAREAELENLDQPVNKPHLP